MREHQIQDPRLNLNRSLRHKNKPIDRVIPDGCSDILFSHDLKRGRYSVLFCGLSDEPFAIRYDRDYPLCNFGIRFFPEQPTRCSVCRSGNLPTHSLRLISFGRE